MRKPGRSHRRVLRASDCAWPSFTASTCLDDETNAKIINWPLFKKTFARRYVGGGESAAVLRDCRRDLRVPTKLGFHADGIDRQDIAARRISILGHAKRYWIVQGDYLRRVYNSVSIIKWANLVIAIHSVVPVHSDSWRGPFVRTRTSGMSPFQRDTSRTCMERIRSTASQSDGAGIRLIQVYVVSTCTVCEIDLWHCESVISDSTSKSERPSL